MGTALLTAICSILMVVGLIGVVVPFLPGVPLAWLGIFIYALVTGFEKISIAATVTFFVVMVFTLSLDFLAPMLGARKYQASKWGVIGVFIGFIAGTLILGIWGVVLGPFAGAMAGELIAKRQPERALKSAIGAVLGFLAGTLFKITVVLIMIGFFIVSII